MQPANARLAAATSPALISEALSHNALPCMRGPWVLRDMRPCGFAIHAQSPNLAPQSQMHAEPRGCHQGKQACGTGGMPLIIGVAGSVSESRLKVKRIVLCSFAKCFHPAVLHRLMLLQQQTGEGVAVAGTATEMGALSALAATGATAAEAAASARCPTRTKSSHEIFIGSGGFWGEQLLQPCFFYRGGAPPTGWPHTTQPSKLAVPQQLAHPSPPPTLSPCHKFAANCDTS